MALAQTAARDQTAASVDELIVNGARVRSLDQFTPTGSRLVLSAQETPATLDLITAETMETRGFLNVEEAANSLSGVTSGGTPGSLETFHMRGFSGTQVTMLHNGIYLGPSDMVNRPHNAFNVQTVEILKGPASVLYGQGAIGGAINVTNKKPSFGPASYNAYLSGGSFGTYAVGLGGSTALSDTVAVRVDVSRTGTDGFVNNTPGYSTEATLSLVWRPTDRLSVQASIDLLKDSPSAYWGTPLVTSGFAGANASNVATTTTGLTIDKRLREVNYNVADGYIHSSQYWPTVLVKWETETLTLQNYTYFFHADRQWANSEAYSFNAGTNLIDRDRFFVFHKQNMFGNQASGSWKHKLGGMDNQLVVGVDYSHLDFVRDRGFPDGDSVDPFNPAPSAFGPIVKRTSPTKWDDTAIFFEDILSLTPNLKLVTGGRYDRLALDRKNFGPTGVFIPGSSFSRTYTPVTWRAGVVYNATPQITPYLSFTTGQDPVGSNIFLVNSGENFDLGKSRQVEAGVKAETADRRASMTVAIYDIKRKNILQAVSPVLAVPVGSEISRGLEASGDWRVTDTWTLNANTAYNEAKYGQFAYVDGTGAVVNASGNTIANAPRWISNVWTSVSNVGGLPLELGGGIRYVGERKGDDANTLTLKRYATLNLYATWSVTPNVDLSLRVDNATDQFYAQSADIFYPTQVQLGRPRFAQIDLRAHF